MKNANLHEDLLREESIEGITDEKFGLFVSVVCILVGLIALFMGYKYGFWWIGLSALALVCTYVQPQLLHPLNAAWFKLGLLMFSISNPLVMGALYFLCITPMAFIAKALSKDFLKLKREPKALTYWICRKRQIMTSESMKDQF